jgi:DNA-directed RNA polymerase specialized sigma24 family protein
MTILPHRSYHETIRQTDWVRRHLHEAQDCLALARRLSGSLEAAQEIHETAMCHVIRDGNWHRIINPQAYLMRLIFDIAVARMDAALLPAAQFISDREVGPLPVHGRTPGEVAAVVAAIKKMTPARRKILWAWRVELQPLKDIARQFHVKPEAVSRQAAQALGDFHEHLQAAFCDPAQVCQRTDSFFGGTVVQSTAKRPRPWWGVSRADRLPLLIGVNIGIWGAAATAGIAVGLSQVGEWLR